jgi:hypothetical protein
MHALTPQAMLRVWEAGFGQQPVDRALTILLHASGGESAKALAALTVGERDRRLLSAREQTFGHTLEAYAECGACGERLEFTLTTDAIRCTGPDTADKRERLCIDGVELSLRLPSSNDLRALSACSDIHGAHAQLLERCIVAATRDGAPIVADALPPNVIAGAAARMTDLDPQAEVLLDLRCPTCNANQQVLFDIAAFFWSEIGACAKRLLREVHLLARAYCWREADILAMSAWRRECYLAMVQG